MSFKLKGVLLGLMVLLVSSVTWASDLAQAPDQPLAKLQGCGGGTVQFSPDGTLILICDLENGDARVWDAKTFQPTTPPLHDEDMSNATFSADSRLVFTAGRGRVWDAHTGKQVAGPFAGWGQGINMSDDGSRAAMQDQSNVEVFDAATGKRLAVVGGTDPGLRNDFAQFNRDATRLVTTEHDDIRRLVHLWDARTFKPIVQLTARSDRRPGYYNALRGAAPVAFSPDGTLLAVRQDWGFAVYHSADGRKVFDNSIPFPLGVPDVRSEIAFTPDGHGIVLFLAGGLSMWDARSGARLAGAIHLGDNALGPLNTGWDGWSCNSDGSRMALARATKAEGTTTRWSTDVWDFTTGKVVQHLRDGDYGGTGFSPDGRFVATGSVDDHCTWVWRVR
jgi:WD40 repeat protein